MVGQERTVAAKAIAFCSVSPRRRYWVYALLFLLATINYVDRVALSVAAKPISAEFSISAVQMGYLFSSFLWLYLICLIPMGVIVDRFGARAVNACGMALWSMATMGTGLAGSFISLVGSRIVMGVGEATTYPAGGRVIREWAPKGERGFATAVFNSGSYAGPALGAVVIAVLVDQLGWRGAFIVAGLAGFLWLAVWLILFRAPEQAKFLGSTERMFIIGERDASVDALAGRGRSASLLSLLRSRTMWGLALTQGCAVYTQYLFLTWLPNYLQATRDIPLIRTGAYTSLSYAIAVIFGILLGWISDQLLTVDGVRDGSRRTMVVCAMLGSAIILIIPFVDNIWLILALVTISLTGISTACSLNIALVNDLLRSPQDAGKAMGILVTGGNIFGILAPIITGYVIANTGHYDGAFAIAGILLLIGATICLTMTRHPIMSQPALSPQEDRF